jgi:RNA polymerase sigma-70 factor (ECF subfamily)
MNLTRWRIADKFKSRPRAEVTEPTREPDSPQTAAVERIPDDVDRDAAWEQEWQRHLLDAACERIARRVKPRHFQAFDLYVRQHQPVLQVGRELGMNPATVYLIGHRLTKELKTEVEKLRVQLG